MNLTEVSKKEFLATGIGTHEDINTGCLQRIADNCEMMATKNKSLEEESERFHRFWKNESERADRLERSNRSLRGVITRMKKGK
jgi:hypothetical protein